MLREDYIFIPTVSEPAMTQKKRTKKQIYLEVMARGQNSNKVTQDDIDAYDYWCDHVAGDLSGYTSMPMPPWLIDLEWVDERNGPWSYLVTMPDGMQKLMSGMSKEHIGWQLGKKIKAKKIKQLKNADMRNEEFLVKLDNEISENNEINGRPNSKKKL